MAGFYLRGTLRGRLGGYAALVVLVALLGGIAMGAVAAARRTQSSFPRFMAGTNASDLLVNDFTSRGGPNDIAFEAALARLPHVTHVAGWRIPNVLSLNPDNSPAPTNADASANGVFIVASTDGLLRDQDRATILRGRAANPARNEAVMSSTAARVLGARLGQTVRLGFFGNAQAQQNGYGTVRIAPRFAANVTIVGVVAYNNAVMRDDIDRLPTFILLSPAIGQHIQDCSCYAPGVMVGMKLDGGARAVPTVEREIARNVPDAAVTWITSVLVAKAERATAPLSIALGVFGLIAAFAAIVVSSQAIGRLVRSQRGDLEVVRALGGEPSLTMAAGLFGVFIAVVAGTVLATLLAAGLSQLAPLGVIGSVADHSIAVDWAVFGFGALTLVLVLGAVAVALVYRNTRGRASRRRAQRAVPFDAMTNLSPTAATAVTFAIEPGGDTNAAPVGSVIASGALGVLVVVATLVFGASLHTLVSRPSLYGWNWDYELRSAYSGISNIPENKANRALAADPNVAAWTGAYFATTDVGNVTVPVIGVTPAASVGPTLLSGAPIRSDHDVLLGASTLAALHAQVGQTISVKFGNVQTPLKIVGTAALPAVGIATQVHTDLTTGAVVSERLLKGDARGFGSHDGPEAYFVRMRRGVDPTAARRQLVRDTEAMSTSSDDDGPVSLLAVQRPAEIVNYRTIRATPLVLSGGLAIGAVLALILTLIASVRRRRRDLALLKTFGFTRSQLARVVAWQSFVAVGLGLVIGMPLGVVVGRVLWERFAHAIHVLPAPTVPIPMLLIIGASVFVIAPIIALIPARNAARVPAALVLRQE